MIRLIASDLDGTLLEPNGSMPEGIVEVIHALDALGIRFAAASGRQFGNLRRLFPTVAHQMAFVCENGAVNALNGEVIGTVAIPKEMAFEILEDLEKTGMNVLVSGRHTCYLLGANRAYADDIVYRLKNTVTIVDDLRAIPEPMLKISGQCDAGVTSFAPALLEKWGNRLTATVSGRDWFDFSVANKGTGISMLMERLGLDASEVAAFGDQFNDESMLDLVGYPFLMEKADPALQKPGVRLVKKVIPMLWKIVEAKGNLM
ncbi:MAG: HAD-IIB family hydrolase [Clostridia bacterium]